MKKIFALIITLLAFSILCCGCMEPQVERMRNWSFQEDSDQNTYSLFFAFCDKNDKEIAAKADVLIRVKDESGTVLYTAKKHISEEDFANYSNLIRGDHYMARISFPKSAVDEGCSHDGTIEFTVTNEDKFSFDVVSIDIDGVLPAKPVIIEAEELPCEIKETFSGLGTMYKVKINEVEYEEVGGYSPYVQLTIKGEKTYEGTYGSAYNSIEYKVYDAEDYVVTSGTVMLKDLAVGDKFKDDSIKLRDLTPGETYTIRFMDKKY